MNLKHGLAQEKALWLSNPTLPDRHSPRTLLMSARENLSSSPAMILHMTVNGYDTIVIGAGQTGLASAYYLQRADSRFLVLDGASHIGESWLRRWDSLRLFTPVRSNSLPACRSPVRWRTLAKT
jgi:hypothetical protein